MAYFLLSVSTRTNLDLCLRFAQAGLTSSIKGVWAFLDIEVGDYVSFLYGAKAFNLYRVIEKHAIKDAHKAPPWEPLTFKSSGLTYNFPFRLELAPLCRFQESLVRPEFAYVAENLLLRGGYYKTQFQADQTTLQSVSQMGIPYKDAVESLDLTKYERFQPKFTLNRSLVSTPEVFYLQEDILHVLTRHYLSTPDHLNTFIQNLQLDKDWAHKFESLGEKAFPEGHIDILLKERIPIGTANQIIVEVKTAKARQGDVEQVKAYSEEIPQGCLRVVLLAQSFSKPTKEKALAQGINCFEYFFSDIDLNRDASTFEELERAFTIAPSRLR
jgi:hypothetical protein